MKTNVRSHIFLLISAILFGGNYIVGKLLLGNPFTPGQIILTRMACATVIFSVLARLAGPVRIDRKDYLRLAACGLFGIALNQSLFFFGLQFTTPINASIIHTTSPILVLLFAYVILKETITLKKTLGILLGLLGAYLMVTQGKFRGLDGDLFAGNLIIFLNITAYSLYLVLSKPLFEKYGSFVVMKWVYALGMIMAIPFTIQTAQLMPWQAIDTKAAMLMIYLILGTSVIGYTLISIALKQVNASLVGFYIYLQPVFTTLFAYIIGTDALTPLKIFSMALIFLGIYLISCRR